VIFYFYDTAGRFAGNVSTNFFSCGILERHAEATLPFMHLRLEIDLS